MVMIFKLGISSLSGLQLIHLLVGLISNNETPTKNKTLFFFAKIQPMQKTTFKIIKTGKASESKFKNGNCLGETTEFREVAKSKTKIPK